MIVTRIYDWLRAHRWVRVVSLIVVTLVLAGAVLTLHFSEDITDFLPLDSAEKEHMALYQKISGADDLYILFSGAADAERTVDAIDAFEAAVRESDKEGWCTSLQSRFDTDEFQRISGFVYDNIPYFLTERDYARMDSLLADPGYPAAALARDRELLLLPTSGLLGGTVSRDPLGLFSPVLGRLQTAGASYGFTLVDGCTFTPDMSRAVVRMQSPFGSSETEHNARLLDLLEGAVAQMQTEFPEVKADMVGGPAIAVGNSSRIKKDSVLAIGLSAILIILLLAYSFHNLRNILLIFLSVGWGMLFALGGMALFTDRVSIIVIGIASVILGIAVNYPLHLIAHTAHQPRMPLALREITAPLVVGNITTVGAFLALVPLKATALSDLGLFASLLLVGTILFVLLYLPHYVAVQPERTHESRVLDFLSRLSPENSKVFVVATLLLTLVLGWFSFRTGFDTDMSHINYMTDSQRADMQYFEDLMTRDDSHAARSVYVYSRGASYEEALARAWADAVRIDSLAAAGLVARQNALPAFIAPAEEQAVRLDRWRAFVLRHGAVFASLEEAGRQQGFASGAFKPFLGVVDETRTWKPQDFAFFTPLTGTVFARSFTTLGDEAVVVHALNVGEGNISTVKEQFADSFDVGGMNASLSSSLSDNFNYIGWACSLIVFLFLWFSFGRIELALISFLPMAVSWVWILGLMALTGVKFNIVNIILATFIFGQGDDYTIFMTEGCQYEFTHRRPILASYKSSILQSAAIMFVGIGTLIVARHPAMRSLAEVTIIGMFSVVLMAYMIPPLLFKWLTARRGQTRTYPLTLRSLLVGAPHDPVARVRGRYIYKGKELGRAVRRSLRARGAEILQYSAEGPVNFTDEGYGELAILLALTHPEATVTVTMTDLERLQVARVAAEGFVENIKFNEI